MFLVPQVRKISCMQTGEILASLMTEHDLNLRAVADRVRAQGARNVRYQHIQQLLEFPTRRPRFLPELAAAFGLTVEQFLAYQPGSSSSVREEGAVYAASHPLGMDPEILASSTRLVRLACESLEVSFDPEDATDAAIVLLAAAYLRERAERAVTADNVVDFTKLLRKRMKGANQVEDTDAGSAGRRVGREGQKQAG